jgi:hypothetical protein
LNLALADFVNLTDDALQCDARKKLRMTTATIPSLRVEPELRTAAEDVLEEGETLSGFVEQSIRDGIQRR